MVFEEEAVSAGLRKMTLEEVQRETTRLLEAFDALCAEHGLKYSIAYGTYLGAIRHGGPIPWDDDVDVVMPREDYDRLCTLRPSSAEGGWGLLDADEDDYPWFYGKFCSTRTVSFGSFVRRPEGYGVFIDVFPLDKLPDDGREARRFYRMSHVRTGLVWLEHVEWSKFRLGGAKERLGLLVKRAICGIPPWLSMAEQKRRVESYIRKFDARGGREYCLVACNTPYGIEQDRLLVADFEKLARVPYDGIEVAAFEDSEGYLCRVYGKDWRTPVVKETHGTAYWKGGAASEAVE